MKEAFHLELVSNCDGGNNGNEAVGHSVEGTVFPGFQEGHGCVEVVVGVVHA